MEKKNSVHTLWESTKCKDGVCCTKLCPACICIRTTNSQPKTRKLRKLRYIFPPRKSSRNKIMKIESSELRTVNKLSGSQLKRQ